MEDHTDPPPLRQLPLEVAAETFVVRAVQHSLGGSLSTSMNSLVIRAAQPVIVDTGMVTDRATFFEDVFALVEPDDVRWIYLTHDDDDHSGNVMEALDRCPNAKGSDELGGTDADMRSLRDPARARPHGRPRAGARRR